MSLLPFEDNDHFSSWEAAELERNPKHLVLATYKENIKIANHNAHHY